MGHVHVEMSITKSKKVPLKYEKDVIEDIKVMGRSETRKEFDEAKLSFKINGSRLMISNDLPM